jgi:predicted RNase H-like nuclease (RuvC/YqgF family)
MGPSDEDLIKLYVQKTAEQSQILEMFVSRQKSSDKERVALEKECTDKDHQISQLQAEVDSLRAEREELIGFKERYEKMRESLQRIASGDM